MNGVGGVESNHARRQPWTKVACGSNRQRIGGVQRTGRLRLHGTVLRPGPDAGFRLRGRPRRRPVLRLFAFVRFPNW